MTHSLLKITAISSTQKIIRMWEEDVCLNADRASGPPLHPPSARHNCLAGPAHVAPAVADCKFEDMAAVGNLVAAAEAADYRSGDMAAAVGLESIVEDTASLNIGLD